MTVTEQNKQIYMIWLCALFFVYNCVDHKNEHDSIWVNKNSPLCDGGYHDYTRSVEQYKQYEPVLNEIKNLLRRFCFLRCSCTLVSPPAVLTAD